MITYKKLGRNGNLGNQLFQIASVLSLGNKHKQKAVFPDWKYEKYFKIELPKGRLDSCLHVKEKCFEHYEWNISDEDINIEGWLQSEKYFDESIVRTHLEFTDELVVNIKDRFSEAFKKKTILISIRRGDFVGNKVYFQLPITYYLLALFEQFPDWIDYNIIITSDDIDYCKLHFDCLDNVYFSDGCSDIEQLCLGSMCDNFIISNSTFSWWQAWLAGKKVKVIRPLKNFDGEFSKINNDKDYFPDYWKIFDHLGKKIDLSDTTFIVPVSHDHKDRKYNTNLSICLIQRDFNTNVFIGEQGTNLFGYTKKFAKYIRFNGMKHFHRTKMLNDMIKDATTDYVVNWDCDTVLPPLRIYMSVYKLRKGIDFVYPFDGRVYHVPRIPNFNNLEKSLDIGIYGMNNFIGKNGKDITSSVGHAIFYNKNSFIESGMENENMISYAPEDCERWDRFNLLGYNVERIKGAMFHLVHWRGKDSSNKNPFFKSNWKELKKMRLMTKQEMIEYVSTWDWLK